MKRKTLQQKRQDCERILTLGLVVSLLLIPAITSILL